MPGARLKEKRMEPENKDQAPGIEKPEVTPAAPAAPKPPRETGGPKGLEPTRYQDWERNGRCIDF